MDKGIQKLIKFLRKKGWQVDAELGKHYKIVISKENFKSKTFVVSATSSDANNTRIVVGQFRKSLKAGGFDTLDNYHSYFITEYEFDDVLEAIAERLTNIADAGGTYEEATGHMEIFKELLNVAGDDFFTDDENAINEWVHFRKKSN
jgi:hypothetical protein